MRKFEYVSRLDAGYGLPKRSTKSSAGYDFIAQEKYIIPEHGTVIVKTGVKATFPEDEVLLLFNRSSNPLKKGLVIPNGVGVIDADYYNNESNEGEIGFIFYNMTDTPVEINPGDKLGQGMFVKYGTVDNDESMEERSGGFGSTGK